MARDAVSIVEIERGTPSDLGAGTTINPTNGAEVAAAGDTDFLVIRVTNTAAAAKNLTIAAGVNPPAQTAAEGDAVHAIDASGDVVLTVESARHAQADGAIYLDFETGFVGKVWAVRPER